MLCERIAVAAACEQRDAGPTRGTTARDGPHILRHLQRSLSPGCTRKGRDRRPFARLSNKWSAMYRSSDRSSISNPGIVLVMQRWRTLLTLPHLPLA